jgi:hypothetical protein
MPKETDRSEERSFQFQTSPAVAGSRARTHYVNCAVCQTDNSSYLFHKAGVRFVRCRTCGMVYVNPVGSDRTNYFEIGRSGQYPIEQDRQLCLKTFEEFLVRLETTFAAARNEPLCRTVLLGRYYDDFADSDVAKRVGLRIATVDDDGFGRLALESDIGWAKRELDLEPQIIILHEFLEACSDPAAVVERLSAAAPPNAWFVVTFSNVRSLPAQLMRRYWPQFFNVKTTFFDMANLAALMARFHLGLRTQFPFLARHTLSYVLRRVAPESTATKLVAMTPADKLDFHLRTGHHVAVFQRQRMPTTGEEKLSIVFPVYNEAKYVAQVIETILQKQLKIDKELIIVESNSKDGTREIVQGFEGRPGVRVILEDRPEGKGHAVRTGLHAVTGTIVLIQDADFEYDIDDYDALLEPILQRRTSFVLGSRSLGLGDWKVRKFARGAGKAALLNLGQLVFAHTFNVLYQKNITDVNTMFKVFRAECLDGLDLESNGFELDIELACKLVRNGYAPIEVPVNYVARGFDEGKKISFSRDAITSYAAFFRYRFE